MLLYGTSRVLPFLSQDTIVYNFTGLVEHIPSLQLLPPRELGASSEYEFDMTYYQYVIGNDVPFDSFMCIIMNLYEGKCVFLITQEDDWSQMLIESVLKMIQQRYGINATKICSEEDIFYAEDSDFDPGFGLYNLDQDKERYLYLHKDQINVEKEINGED